MSRPPKPPIPLIPIVQAGRTASAIADAFAFAQQMGGASGFNLEFSPSPSELQARVATSYSAPSTRLFCFETSDGQVSYP